MIPVAFSFSVYADSDYCYKVDVSDETINLQYEETQREPISIGFGSIDEMEAVARAMLKAVKLQREM